MIKTIKIQKCDPVQSHSRLKLLLTITVLLLSWFFPQLSAGSSTGDALTNEDLVNAVGPVEGLLAAQTPQAVVNAFYAYVDSGRVTVEWETITEVNIIGFQIQRLHHRTGKFRSISKKNLPALLVSPEGGTYRYIDKRAKPGQKLTYKLIAIGINGERQSFGPFAFHIIDLGLGDLLAVDSAFESVYVNGEPFSRKIRRQLNNVKTQSIRKRSSEEKQGRTGVYISIEKNGLHRLTASQIAESMNVPLSQIIKWLKKNRLSITCQGQPVAWKPTADNSGLIFYAEGIDSLFTSTNVYKIARGKGVTIASKDMPVSSDGLVSASFTQTIHAEEDRWALTALYKDPYDDFWCWDYLRASYAHLATKAFLISAPGQVADTAGIITVELKGGSRASHKVVVTVNDIPVGETTFVNQTNHEHQFSIPAGGLIDGDNRVTLTAIQPATGSSIIYVNRMGLTYEKATQAQDDRLFFNSAKAADVRVNGFLNDTISLYDITNPGKITEIKSTVIAPSEDGRFGIRFGTDGAKRDYLAITESAITSLNDFQITGSLAPQLMNTWHAVDYLIITHHTFKEEIQRLADYRRSKGLAVLVVEIQDIYDEFNYGIANPDAVRDFLEYAWHNWAKAPRYVVRIGNGSYDYKDTQQTGDTQMPPVMVKTPWGLFASENKLADVDGSEDGIPEMALGLIPANTVEDLSALIDKIIGYESTTGEWKKRVLLTADNPDKGGNFHADSDTLAALVPTETYDLQSIYLGPLSITEARQTLTERLNNGVFMMNYFGHANHAALAGENLWRSSDVAIMENDNRLPILLGMTCLAGRFEIPGVTAISEAMVTKPNGGAIAAWAPTGMALNNLSRILAEEFFRSVLIDNERVLGEAILTAMAAYKERYPLGNPYMLDIYTLFGDPALIIQ